MVTTNPANPNFNADVAGDFVVDTNAAFKNASFCIDASGFPQYMEEPTFTDFVGDRYVNIQSENLMQVRRVGANIPSLQAFTVGQEVRMYQSALNDTQFNFIRRPISTLYEIIGGQYYFGGPIENNTSQLQPGYDYTLVACDCVNIDCLTPSPYGVTEAPSTFTTNQNTVINYNSTTPYANLKHLDGYAIIIDEFQPSYDDLPNPQNPYNVRRCFDTNQRTSTPVGGRIIRFRDGTLNSNVEMTPKDSIQINNTRLIEELSPGLYAIEKFYIEGATEQTVIQKPNGN